MEWHSSIEANYMLQAREPQKAPALTRFNPSSGTHCAAIVALGFLWFVGKFGPGNDGGVDCVESATRTMGRACTGLG